MESQWNNCKNILCIRPDNMGDLLMSTPAIRALKELSGAKITVLTSAMAEGIARHIPEIDELIVCNLPWVKLDNTLGPEHFLDIIKEIKSKNFDAAVVFSVYSQNPLPAVMLAYMAEIPLRLAYCRENPYDLLTHWVPDREPYSVIKHQVKRDLDLVATVGAVPSNDKLSLEVSANASITVMLEEAGVDTVLPWIILHAGVSEKKREYPFDLWVETAQRLIEEFGYQVLLTGGPSEKELTDQLQLAIGERSFSMGGYFSLIELVALINKAPLLISVNTGTVHIAAAVNTPVIVLYALTNPQHFPWKAVGKVLPYSIPEDLHSKNEVIRYVNQKYFSSTFNMVYPFEIISAAKDILNDSLDEIPEIHDEWLAASAS